ncbi:DeoR/GlpR family DNA-binding transcription regulator [Fuerstiella marisgermanici]|uniref:Glycerol-3-phosphate regulon repressor n=1 Tax=Fuerstiella marisgermanici TaxID=1891926 RepID=A0A1P8WII0_9PLAN|nr:DeoR/GlpR family DNA-binding transcription regulator [Fuerstiella marisgermanici]APZ93862.1 Glycerol-3-phosphate regulon repressor [Fuerstiella marisgermanici]
MITDERRSKILQIAEESGFVSLQQLVAEVGASESTIRRDLEYLDTQGHLHRTRGGAAYAGESLMDFDVRQNQASREKQLIAQRTAERIPAGETVLLDGGTTTLEVARFLNGKPLQVVTNSLPIASLLMNQPEIELIFVGGYVYPKTGVALGDQAIEALKKINVSRLVMSTGGVTSEGLFNSNALLVETERQMIASAERVTLVADSTKFGQRALSHLCPLSAVHEIVTDDGMSDEWRQTLLAGGIELEVVEVQDRSMAGST